MKLTNGEMSALINSMNKQGFIQGATGETGYAIYRNLRILQNEFEDYNKILNETIVKYGQANEDGIYTVSPEDKEAYKSFQDIMIPLNQLIVEVSGLYHIDKDKVDIPYCKDATPADYANIEALLTFQEHDK